jgi:hypothetical protein
LGLRARLNKKISAIEGTGGALDRACERLVREIIAKTLAGRDFRGRFWEGYADSTKAQKRRDGLSEAPANLSDTGDMLSSLRCVRERDGGNLQVRVELAGGANPSNEEKGSFHNSGGPNLPKREFMGISNAQAERIKREIREELRRN